MTDKKQTYSIVWDAECHNPPLERIPAGKGACDSMVVCSILHLSDQVEMLDGATSTLIVTKNGRTREKLPPAALFQVWVTMADHLSKMLPDGWRKYLCTYIAETMSRELRKG